MAVLPPDPVFSLRCPEMGAVNSICFHQNERILAGTVKGSVFLWNLQTNRSSLHFSIGSEPIISLHHTSDLLISQEKGGTVTVWSMSPTAYVRQRSIEGNHIGFCRSAMYMNLSSGGGDNLLFYPSGENSIGALHISDIESPPQLFIPEKSKFPELGHITCIKPFELASQIFVLAGYESGHFITWELSSGTVVDSIQMEPDPMAVDYDPITNRGVIGGPTEKLIVFSYKRQSMQMQRGSDISIKNAGINCIRIRSDQKVFATGGWDGRVRIFSWKSLRPLAVLTEHKSGGVMDIAYSEGKVDMWHAPIMASAGMDGQISLWDLYN